MPSAPLIQKKKTGWPPKATASCKVKNHTGDGISTAPTTKAEPGSAKNVTSELSTPTFSAQTSTSHNIADGDVAAGESQQPPTLGKPDEKDTRRTAIASELWPRGQTLESYNESATWFSCKATGKAIEATMELGWIKGVAHWWVHNNGTDRWFFEGRAPPTDPQSPAETTEAKPGSSKSVEARNTTPAATSAKPTKKVVFHNMAQNDDTIELSSTSHSLVELYDEADWTTASGRGAWPCGQTLHAYEDPKVSAIWFWCPATKKSVQPSKESGWEKYSIEVCHHAETGRWFCIKPP